MRFPKVPVRRCAVLGPTLCRGWLPSGQSPPCSDCPSVPHSTWEHAGFHLTPRPRSSWAWDECQSMPAPRGTRVSQQLLQGLCERRKVTFSLHHKDWMHTQRPSDWESASIWLCVCLSVRPPNANAHRHGDTLAYTRFTSCYPHNVAPFTRFVDTITSHRDEEWSLSKLQRLEV